MCAFPVAVGIRLDIHGKSCLDLTDFAKERRWNCYVRLFGLLIPLLIRDIFDHSIPPRQGANILEKTILCWNYQRF